MIILSYFLTYNIIATNYLDDNVLDYDCINLIKISEWNEIKFSNLDKNFESKLNNNFIVWRVYNKYIEKNKWLNLYILKNKNAK